MHFESAAVLLLLQLHLFHTYVFICVWLSGIILKNRAIPIVVCGSSSSLRYTLLSFSLVRAIIHYKFNCVCLDLTFFLRAVFLFFYFLIPFISMCLPCPVLQPIPLNHDKNSSKLYFNCDGKFIAIGLHPFCLIGLVAGNAGNCFVCLFFIFFAQIFLLLILFTWIGVYEGNIT